VAVALIVLMAALLYFARLPQWLHWPGRVVTAASAVFLIWSVGRKVMVTKFEAKKVCFSLGLVLLMYGALHVMCLVFVKLMSARDERLSAGAATELSEKTRRGIEAVLAGTSVHVFDRDIGWLPRAGHQWHTYTVNEQGVRATREHPTPAPDPSKRILCLGDSFTFGHEVGDHETYPHHGEQLLPGTEWVNLGINGSGLTQALLHYRKTGRAFGGKYVVIGFMTNNSKRTVNCFRPFISPGDAATPFTMPYAKYVDGKFTIEPNPYSDVSEYRRLLDHEREELEKLRKLDYLTWSNQHDSPNPLMRTLNYIWEAREGRRNLDVLLGRDVDHSAGKLRHGVDPYGQSIWHPRSRGFQAITRVFDTFYNEVLADGRVPLIVILPAATDVEDRKRGIAPNHGSLLKYLSSKGYRHFDFLDTLEKTRKGEEFSTEAIYVDTHFESVVNHELAQAIIKALEPEGISG
jgi:hypothetical protein